jgi:hypothetical protein
MVERLFAGEGHWERPFSSSGLNNPPPPLPSRIAGKSDSPETFQQLFFGGEGANYKIKMSSSSCKN